MIDRTWTAIKPDTLCDLTSNPDAVGRMMTQKEIIETLADPSYLEIYGKDEEAVKTFRSLSKEGQERILKKVFAGNTNYWFPT